MICRILVALALLLSPAWAETVTTTPAASLGSANVWTGAQTFAAGPYTPSIFPCLDRATGVYDGQTYRLPLTWTSGQNSLTIGATLSATGTVTTAMQSNLLTITGSQPLTQGTHWYHPITIALGNGVVWSDIVLGVTNSGGDQIVRLSKGAPVAVTALAGAAINVGVRLTSANVGQVISFGVAGGGGGTFNGTIATVTGNNTVTLSSNVTFAPPTYYGSSAPIDVSFGTDNYSALNLAVNTALAAGADTLACDRQFLVSKVPGAITRVFLRGTGNMINTTGGTDGSPASYVARPVVPWSAPPPMTMPNSISKSALASLSGKATVRVTLIGASTATEDSGSSAFATGWTRRMEAALASANPGVNFVWTRYAQGGGNASQYVGFTSPTVGDWYSSGLWTGNQTNSGYAYASNPDLIIVEWSANDVPAKANVTAFVAWLAMVKNWPTPPAIIVVYDPYQNTGAPNNNNAWYDSWAVSLKELCGIWNVGFVDLRTPLMMTRNGYDPRHSILERMAPPMTTVTNYNPTFLNVNGFEMALSYNGTPLAFWAAMGNVAAFPMWNDNDNGNTVLANPAVFGYDQADGYPGAPSATPDMVWMRFDFGQQLPGHGTRGGTMPRLYGTYAMSALSNVITYTPFANGPATAWVAGDNGKVVTVVGAGSTSTGAAANVRATPVLPGGTSVGHLVGYLKWTGSGTSVQIFADSGLTVPLNAVTAISGQGFGVMFGSPRVYAPQITGIAAGGSGVQTFRVSIRDGEAVVNFGGNSRTMRVRVAQPGAFGTHLNFLLGGNPSASFIQNSNGLPEFFLARGRRMLVAPSMTDDSITGPATFDNAALTTGGSGANHPSQLVNQMYSLGFDGLNLTIP